MGNLPDHKAIIFATVQNVCNKLTDDELISINLIVQLDRDPRYVEGYEKIKDIFYPGNNMMVHDDVKWALAIIMEERL